MARSSLLSSRSLLGERLLTKTFDESFGSRRGPNRASVWRPDKSTRARRVSSSRSSKTMSGRELLRFGGSFGIPRAR